MIKTKTQTKAAAVNAVTITSPNSKMIRIWGYSVSFYGSAALSADVTIQLTDEDGNVLWEDGITRAIANQSPTPAKMVFPKPIFIPVGKNAVLTAASGGANTTTEVSVLYDI
ncbi:MAG: hypothetical protein ACE5HX_10175 [bacterium]